MRRTSIDAFKSVDHKSIQDRVLDMIKSSPLTCDEVEMYGWLKHQTASSSLTALSKAGKIVDSGSRRPTRSGRSAIVWKVPNGQGELFGGAK